MGGVSGRGLEADGRDDHVAENGLGARGRGFVAPGADPGRHSVSTQHGVDADLAQPRRDLHVHALRADVLLFPVDADLATAAVAAAGSLFPVHADTGSSAVPAAGSLFPVLAESAPAAVAALASLFSVVADSGSSAVAAD